MKIRKSSRAILINPENEIFLFKFEFAMLSTHKTLWVTPGGEVENGESFEQALSRELFEEMGINIEGNYKRIYYRNKPFATKNGEKFISEERYYLVKITHPKISFRNMTRNEHFFTKDWKWWSVKELQNTSESFF